MEHQKGLSVRGAHVGREVFPLEKNNVSASTILQRMAKAVCASLLLILALLFLFLFVLLHFLRSHVCGGREHFGLWYVETVQSDNIPLYVVVDEGGSPNELAWALKDNNVVRLGRVPERYREQIPQLYMGTSLLLSGGRIKIVTALGSRRILLLLGGPNHNDISNIHRILYNCDEVRSLYNLVTLNIRAIEWSKFSSIHDFKSFFNKGITLPYITLPSDTLVGICVSLESPLISSLVQMGLVNVSYQNQPGMDGDRLRVASPLTSLQKTNMTSILLGDQSVTQPVFETCMVVETILYVTEEHADTTSQKAYDHLLRMVTERKETDNTQDVTQSFDDVMGVNNMVVRYGFPMINVTLRRLDEYNRALHRARGNRLVALIEGFGGEAVDKEEEEEEKGEVPPNGLKERLDARHKNVRVNGIGLEVFFEPDPQYPTEVLRAHMTTDIVDGIQVRVGDRIFLPSGGSLGLRRQEDVLRGGAYIVTNIDGASVTLSSHVKIDHGLQNVYKLGPSTMSITLTFDDDAKNLQKGDRVFWSGDTGKQVGTITGIKEDSHNNVVHVFVAVVPDMDEAGTCLSYPWLITEAECTSNVGPGMKPQVPGVWDAPCKVNAECPFYQANQRYENYYGGCVGSGYCEMPVGVRRVGYRKYQLDDTSFPYCHGCHDSGLYDLNPRTCCDRQGKRPDYAFPMDNREGLR